MTYLISTIFILAILHFVWEAILAPSFRLELRFKLFALRDEVRWLKIEHRDALDDKHFRYLHDSINIALHFLNRIDFVTIAASEREYARNPEFKKRVEARQILLDDCSIAEARSLRYRSCLIVGQAFLVNVGGWLIYLAPILVLMAIGTICVSATGKVRSLFARRIKLWLAVPEPDLERLAHSAAPSIEFAG
jgi:hypothetical protein